MAVMIGAGTFVLFFALMVNAVALFVPFWYQGGGGEDIGLWAQCRCTWMIDSFDDLTDGSKPVWQHAVRWLFTGGLALLIITMLVLFCVSSSGESKSHARAMIAAGALVMIAAVCIAVAVILFGVKYSEEMTTANTIIDQPQQHWAMWLGVAGFALALVASIILLAQGSRHNY